MVEVRVAVVVAVVAVAEVAGVDADRTESVTHILILGPVVEYELERSDPEN